MDQVTFTGDPSTELGSGNPTGQALSFEKDGTLTTSDPGLIALLDDLKYERKEKAKKTPTILREPE